MTEEQFDNQQFSVGDEVVVRKYFGTERMTVHRIDFSARTVNGYCALEILRVDKQNGAPPVTTTDTAAL